MKKIVTFIVFLLFFQIYCSPIYSNQKKQRLIFFDKHEVYNKEGVEDGEIKKEDLIEYVLNTDTKYEVLMYFRFFDKNEKNEEFNNTGYYGVYKDEVRETFFNTEFLDFYYSTLPVKLKNGKKVFVRKNIINIFL